MSTVSRATRERKIIPIEESTIKLPLSEEPKEPNIHGTLSRITDIKDTPSLHVAEAQTAYIKFVLLHNEIIDPQSQSSSSIFPIKACVQEVSPAPENAPSRRTVDIKVPKYDETQQPNKLLDHTSEQLNMRYPHKDPYVPDSTAPWRS